MKKKTILLLMTIIVSIIGIHSVKADSITYDYKKYRVQYYSLGQGTSAWTELTNFNTSTPISNGYGISAIGIRFGQTNNFNAGQTYRIVIDMGLSPINEKQYILYDHTNCYGSTTTTDFNPDTNKISTCEYIGTNDINNSVHRKYIYDITPAENIKGIQFNIYFAGTADISSINVYNTSTITTGPDITNAIDDQTIVIQEEFENITNVITEVNENLINAITEQNTVCEYIDKNKIEIDGKYLASTGNIYDSANFGITSYINIYNANIETLTNVPSNTGIHLCFYDINKTVISCLNSNTTLNENITIPNNSMYVRFSINKTQNKPTYEICKPQGQAIQDTLDQEHSYTTEDITEQVENEHEKQQEILEELDDSYLESYEWGNIGYALENDTPQWILNKLSTIVRTGYFGKILFLYTTILSLGLIKMILGR